MQNGIPWIKIGDVASDAKFIERTEEYILPSGETKSRRVHKGDLLLSNSMSYGRPYILNVEGCIHDGWPAIQDFDSELDRDFLYYLLGSDDVLTQYAENAAGSSVKNLNKEIVGKVVINYPADINEQRVIVSQLEAFETIVSKKKIEINKLSAIKQSLLQYFFG